jgi:hypothetical protein
VPPLRVSGMISRLLLIPGIYTRWVSLYALPLTIGASQFWLVRRGFYFTGAGAELPLVWSIMLTLQAMLGDGPFAVNRWRGGDAPEVARCERAPLLCARVALDAPAPSPSTSPLDGV